MRKFHDAKVAGDARSTIWGTGTPRREFLHVDDLADACLFLMEHYDGDEHINVGTGEDLVDPRARRDGPRRRRIPAATLVFDTSQAGRHAAQAARREPAARARLAASHRAADRASHRPTSGSARSLERGAPPLTSRRSRHGSESSVRRCPRRSRSSPAVPLARSRCAEAYRARRVAHWDAVARIERAGRGARRRAYHRRLERRLPVPAVPPGLRVLELGCGEGDLLASLQPAEASASISRRRWSTHARQRHPELRFVVADAHDLASSDGPFDVIILSDLLHDVWDVQRLLDRLQRLCHPGTRDRHELLQPALGAAARGRGAGSVWPGRC